MTAGTVASEASAKAIIYTEDFEDSNDFTTSISQFTDNGSDFFARITVPGNNAPDALVGTSVSGGYNISGVVGSGFFGGQDIDGEGAGPEQFLQISGINIAGRENLSFSGLFAEDDDGTSQDIDPEDFLRLEYQIDGGGFQNLLWFEGVEFTGGTARNPVNGVFRQDTDFDGTGDGTELTNTLTEFSAAITGTGSLLDLRFTAFLDSGDEDFAIDQFQVTGDMGGVAAIPEPGTMLLLGVAGLGGLVTQRKRLAKLAA